MDACEFSETYWMSRGLRPLLCSEQGEGRALDRWRFRAHGISYITRYCVSVPHGQGSDDEQRPLRPLPLTACVLLEAVASKSRLPLAAQYKMSNRKKGIHEWSYSHKLHSGSC
jgi:hypothetical protein